VASKSIERTRLCAYHARDSGIKDVCNVIEIATNNGVKLSNAGINKSNISHRVISDETRLYWCEEAANLVTELKPELKASIESQGLRDCQRLALENIKEGRTNRIKMACGSGKSRVAIELIKRYETGNFVVFVPYLALLEQWHAYLEQFDWNLIRIGTGYTEEIEFDDENVNVVICVYNSYEKAMAEDNYTFIVVDEAPHIENSCGEGYNSKLASLLEDKSVLMLSASFDGDTSVDYDYSMRQAITDGAICDYDVRIAFFNKEPGMPEIADYLAKNPNYVSVLAYCNTIKSAKLLADKCNELGVAACSISCDDNRATRIKIINQFRAGYYRVLVSVNTLGEGINIPNAQTCLFAEPRNAEIPITQCVGRVLRQTAGKLLAHVVVCTSITKEDKIRSHPVLRILNVLNGDDKGFISKKSGKRTSRLYFDVINVEEDSEMGAFVRENVYDRMMKSIFSGSWMEKFELLKKYKLETGNFPILRGASGIGRWLAGQQSRFRKGVMLKEQLDLLNSNLPGWIRNDRSWNEKLQQVLAYKKENGGLPVHPTNLAMWMNTQRGTYKTGKLSADRIKTLNEILPGWDTTYESLWNVHLLKLIEYHAKHNAYPKNRASLGAWICTQRNTFHQGKLSDEKLAKLDKHFSDWRVIKVDGWPVKLEDYCAKLKTTGFKNAHRVWMSKNRNLHRFGELEQERIDVLNERIPDWSKGLDGIWAENARLVHEFKRIHGRIPNQRESKLGRWLRAQNGNYTNGTMRKDRIDEFLKCMKK
jgi:superfamily II DNA or RNA helicase